MRLGVARFGRYDHARRFQEFAEKLKPGFDGCLRDAEGVMLAVVKVEDMWEPDRESEAKRVFNTTDTGHRPSIT